MNKIRRSAILLVTVIIAAGLLLPAASDTAYAASKPAKVKGVKASSIKTTGYTVKWKKAKRAVKYQIAYKKSTAKKWKFKTTKKKSYKVKKLVQGTTYKVKVRAIRYSKKGKWSKTIKVTTKPTAVTNLYIPERRATSLKLKWTVNKNATKYNVQYSYGDKTVSQNTKGNAGEYVISGLPSGTKFFNIRVRPIAGNQYGAWTEPAKATTTRDDLVITYDPKAAKYERYSINKFEKGKDEELLTVYWDDGDVYTEEGFTTDPIYVTDTVIVDGNAYTIGGPSPTSSDVTSIVEMYIRTECDSSGFVSSCTLVVYDKSNFEEQIHWDL